MKIEPVFEITDEIIDEIQSIHKISREQLNFQNGDTLLIARKGDVILGYAHARESISHILALYVLENQRRSKNKVGGSLLTKTIEGLKNNGANKINAGIEPKNRSVIEFYKKYGFNVINIGKTGFITITLNV